MASRQAPFAGSVCNHHICKIALRDLNHALRYCENTIVIANGTMVASVITAPMLRDIYQLNARIETCSQGRALVIVDGPI
ncbi:hypothetical protein D3C87_2030170 [compost metagenome]